MSISASKTKSYFNKLYYWLRSDDRIEKKDR